MTLTHPSPATGSLRNDFARTAHLLLFIACSVLAAPCFAQTCTPPSASHPTLQQAIDDPACTTVSLGAQAYAEFINISRSLALVGTGPGASTVDGPITVTGATTQVSFSAVGIRNGCAVPGLQINAGARVSTTNVSVAPAAIACPGLPNFLFKDGFEEVASVIF